MNFWDRKLLLGIFLLGGLGLVAVPSVVLLRAVEGYLRFMAGATPIPLPMTHGRAVDKTATPSREPEVRLAPFTVSPARARTVAIKGDFTGWDKELAMSRQLDGSWRIVLPLPPGTYRYLYRVDDRWELDPQGRTSRLGAQKVSEKTIP